MVRLTPFLLVRKVPAITGTSTAVLIFFGVIWPLLIHMQMVVVLHFIGPVLLTLLIFIVQW